MLARIWISLRAFFLPKNRHVTVSVTVLCQKRFEKIKQSFENDTITLAYPQISSNDTITSDVGGHDTNTPFICHSVFQSLNLCERPVSV